MRILIVDDHPIIRRSLRSLLVRRTDWEVCAEAVDGLDAVEKARELRPDVILMDISLPRLTGLEAVVRIRNDVPAARIVIVSQHDPAQMKPKAVEAGAHAYVTKSDLSRELLPAIEAALGG